MKKYLILFFTLLCCNFIYGQSDYPKSYVNIGFGGGPNYGGFGLKSVIGYKSSGILLGAGMLSGMIGYEVGGQLSADGFFMNLGYGTYGVHINGTTGNKELLKGGNGIIGGMINLGKKKMVFLDLGIGYSWGATYKDAWGKEVKLDTVIGIIGIGLRVVDEKKSDGWG